MYTLNTNEVQLVAGGCPACFVAPGGCAVVGGASLVAAHYGYGAAVASSLGLGLLGVAGYLLYQKYQKDNAATVEVQPAQV